MALALVMWRGGSACKCFKMRTRRRHWNDSLARLAERSGSNERRERRKRSTAQLIDPDARGEGFMPRARQMAPLVFAIDEPARGGGQS